jgi:hypothetical protein
MGVGTHPLSHIPEHWASQCYWEGLKFAQTDVSHSCISYVCSATGLVFVQQLWNVNYVQQLQPFIYNFVQWYWLVNIDAFPKASIPHSWVARRFLRSKKGWFTWWTSPSRPFFLLWPIVKTKPIHKIFMKFDIGVLYERCSRQVNFT